MSKAKGGINVSLFFIVYTTLNANKMERDAFIEMAGFRQDVINLLCYIIKMLQRNGGTIDPDMSNKLIVVIDLLTDSKATQENISEKLQEILDSIKDDASITELDKTIKEGLANIVMQQVALRQCVCPALTNINKTLEHFSESFDFYVSLSVNNNQAVKVSAKNSVEEDERVVYYTDADMERIEGYQLYMTMVSNISVDKPVVVIDKNGVEFPLFNTDLTTPILASIIGDNMFALSGFVGNRIIVAY